MLTEVAPRGASNKLSRHHLQPPVILLKNCYAVPCPLCMRILASGLEYSLLLAMLFGVRSQHTEQARIDALFGRVIWLQIGAT